MSTWTESDYRVFADAEEIRIETELPTGELGRPVTIWVVPYDGALYIRSSHGRTSGWFRRASASGRARIAAGGLSARVRMSEVALVSELDAAYAAKYHAFARSFLPRLLAAPAQQAALRLDPAT